MNGAGHAEIRAENDSGHAQSRAASASGIAALRLPGAVADWPQAHAVSSRSQRPNDVARLSSPRSVRIQLADAARLWLSAWHGLLARGPVGSAVRTVPPLARRVLMFGAPHTARRPVAAHLSKFEVSFAGRLTVAPRAAIPLADSARLGSCRVARASSPWACWARCADRPAACAAGSDVRRGPEQP